MRKTLLKLGLCMSINHGKDFEPQFGYNTIHNVPIFNETFRKKKTVFCFVRNPYDWYKSYYGYRKITPWDIGGTIFDKECQAETFQDFIDNVIKNCPYGYVTRLYNYFAPYCTHIGKQEKLQEDMCRFLDIAGERYDKGSIDEKRINNSDVSDLEFRYDQVESIYNIEKETFLKYSYESV